ncbi:copper resistance D family protein [Nocardia stercoris]|uniref:Copper resistance protein CopD n=1 Tax=Nocardia stercoris TaxID=2483361 RepID=A0A3M2LDV5_9NOCA|nr:CopD family protein [Nocardia stercoris]RMI34155.1 copper resistance protein CopD [Nocardia stercoris]
MNRGTTGGDTRGAARRTTAWRTALLLVVPAAVIGVLLGRALAAPDPVQSEATLRALADLAAAVVVGLAALPRLSDRLDPAWRPLAAVAGLWLFAETALLADQAAEVSGTPVARLGTAAFGRYLTGSGNGQIGIAILICALIVTSCAAISFRRNGSAADSGPLGVILVFAAVGLVLRPVTGHMSQQPFGSMFAAVHALAAAGWCGMLLAAALQLRSRGDWAAVLPEYSRWALRAAAAVTVTGIVNALLRLPGLAAWTDTGYGRILLAKTVIAVVLLGLGGWWRRTWVPAASAHRLTADESLRRSVLELVVMSVVFGLAAAVAVAA